MCSMAPQQAAVEAEHVRGLVHYGGDLLELHVAPCRAEASTRRADEVPNTPANSRSVWAMRSAEACIWGAPKGAAVLAGEAAEGALDPARPTKRAASISSSLTETRAW